MPTFLPPLVLTHGYHPVWGYSLGCRYKTVLPSSLWTTSVYCPATRRMYIWLCASIANMISCCPTKFSHPVLHSHDLKVQNDCILNWVQKSSNNEPKSDPSRCQGIWQAEKLIMQWTELEQCRMDRDSCFVSVCWQRVWGSSSPL
jgi:hypothetical protein